MPTLPLGLACVAAATQKGEHDVALVDLLTEKDSESSLKGIFEGFPPDLIGISARNIDDQNMGNPRFLLEPVKEIVARCRSLSEAPIYPHTSLADKAIEEGMIASDDPLLFPQFYLAKGLGDWFPETLKKWAATRPHWIIPDYC